MNEVGARIDAVQSELQASVGEPITKVNGDLAQLSEHLDRLLLVSAERDPSQQITAFREGVLGLIRESAQQLEHRVHGVIEPAMHRVETPEMHTDDVVRSLRERGQGLERGRSIGSWIDSMLTRRARVRRAEPHSR